MKLKIRLHILASTYIYIYTLLLIVSWSTWGLCFRQYLEVCERSVCTADLTLVNVFLTCKTELTISSTTFTALGIELSSIVFSKPRIPENLPGISRGLRYNTSRLIAV